MAKLTISILLSLLLSCLHAQMVVEYGKVGGKSVSTKVFCKTKVKTEDDVNAVVRDMIGKLKFETKLDGRHFYLYVLRMYDFETYGGQPQEVLNHIIYDTNYFLNRMYGSRVQNLP